MATPDDRVRKFAELLLAVSRGAGSADSDSIIACLGDSNRREAAIRALTDKAGDGNMRRLRTADTVLRVLKEICGNEALAEMITGCLSDEERLDELRTALAGPQEQQPWEQYARVPDVLAHEDIGKLLATPIVRLHSASYVALVMRDPAKLASFLRDRLSPRQLAGVRLAFALDGEPVRTHGEIARLLGNTRDTYTLQQPLTRFRDFVLQLRKEAGWDTVVSGQLSTPTVVKLTSASTNLSPRNQSVSVLALGLVPELKNDLTAQEFSALRELLESYGAILEFLPS